LVIKHQHYRKVQSTQDTARDLIDQSEQTPFLVTAEEQTNGRGRHGRQWISPRGNFFGSLVIRAAVVPLRYGEYSFLVAVVLHETIVKFSDRNVRLKWPNDVLLDGHKCAGILIESHGAQNEFLIIGIGVNLYHAPPEEEVGQPAAVLWPDQKPEGENQKLEEFRKQLITSFAQWHDVYCVQGFENVRTAWLKHTHNLGGQITAQTPQGPQSGIFAGIDAQGNLLLTQGKETIKVTTADVLI